MGKRGFDLVVSGMALVVVWPLLLVIALCVRLDSPGPAFYRQERVGRFGRSFTILKFRTMISRPGPEGLAVTPAGDSRVTRLGHWLRRWKLDELPQLVNVLKGDMSLVGPRPEVPRYVELYSPEDRAIVLSVRPGITDEAAIEFRNEAELLGASADPDACYRQDILPRKLQLYGRYVRTRSLLGDVRLLLRTIWWIGRPGSRQ